MAVDAVMSELGNFLLFRTFGSAGRANNEPCLEPDLSARHEGLWDVFEQQFGSGTPHFERRLCTPWLGIPSRVAGCHSSAPQIENREVFRQRVGRELRWIPRHA